MSQFKTTKITGANNIQYLKHFLFLEFKQKIILYGKSSHFLPMSIDSSNNCSKTETMQRFHSLFFYQRIFIPFLTFLNFQNSIFNLKLNSLACVSDKAPFFQWTIWQLYPIDFIHSLYIVLIGIIINSNTLKLKKHIFCCFFQ